MNGLQFVNCTFCQVIIYQVSQRIPFQQLEKGSVRMLSQVLTRQKIQTGEFFMTTPSHQRRHLLAKHLSPCIVQSKLKIGLTRYVSCAIEIHSLDVKQMYANCLCVFPRAFNLTMKISNRKVQKNVVERFCLFLRGRVNLILFNIQRCRQLFESGGAGSSVRGIICPLWFEQGLLICSDRLQPPQPPLQLHL